MVVLMILFVIALNNIRGNNPIIAIPVMVVIAGIIIMWAIERFKQTHGK